jgi:hypothetical protein
MVMDEEKHSDACLSDGWGCTQCTLYHTDKGDGVQRTLVLYTNYSEKGVLNVIYIIQTRGVVNVPQKWRGSTRCNLY